MRRLVSIAVVVTTALALSAAPAVAARPGFVFPAACCYHNGEVVRTVVPPSAFPNEGTDPFYAVMGGVPAQKAVVGLAPGDAGYNGGHWAGGRSARPSGGRAVAEGPADSSTTEVASLREYRHEVFESGPPRHLPPFRLEWVTLQLLQPADSGGVPEADISERPIACPATHPAIANLDSSSPAAASSAES